MKQLLIITFILSLAVMGFAADARGIWYELSAAPGDILTYVNTDFGVNDPDFQLDVVCSAYPSEIISTTTNIGLVVQVFAMDIGTGTPMAWAYADQQVWANNWPEGSTLTFTLTYLPTSESETKVVTLDPGGADMFITDLLVPGATWQIGQNGSDIINPDGPTDTYTLKITSNVPGTIGGNATPYSYPAVGDPADRYGSYAMDPLAGGTWDGPYTIGTSTVWEEIPVDSGNWEYTINFTWTETPPADTYTLTVTSTPTGIEIFKGGVDTGFATDYVFGPTETEADLFGVYTLAAAPEYFHWEPAQWDVQDIYTPRKANGLRSVADTRELYNLTIDFQQVANQYEVTFNVTPATATINGATVYTFNGTAAELFAMTFDIEAPGYVSVMDYVITPADLAAGTVTIVLEEVYVPTYTVNMTTVPAGYITPATLGPVTDPADIYGTYTPTDVSPTGYWTPASLTIDADTEWVADNDNNWVFTQEFVWTETTVYQLTVASTYLGVDEPGYEIFKGGVSTGQFTPWTFESEDQAALYGTYTLENVPGFAWCPQEWIVDASTWAQTKEYAPATIVFDRQQIYTWTVLVLDLNTSSPIEGASIWFDDGVNPPTVVATTIVNGTYTFTCPGDYPGAGTYYVTAAGYNIWDPINVVQTVETMTENLPNSTFYGDWEDPQVPVELSSFTATLTGQFYVQLSWTSQTETQMMGYRVYRNTSAEQSTSELIDNPMIPATNTSTTQNYTVVDADVLIGQTYYYWLEAVDYNSSSFHGPVSVTVTGNVPPVFPEVTTMRNAYPNPFKANGSTNIEVSLKAGDTGTLTIYNVQGQLVKTVSLTEGNHMVNWNGRDSRGNACGSGIYFYKLSTQSMNQTKKMVIVK